MRLEPSAGNVGSGTDRKGRAAHRVATHTSDGEDGKVGLESPSAARVQQFVNECDKSNWY